MKQIVTRQHEITTRTWISSILVNFGPLGFLYRDHQRGYISILRRWSIPIPAF